MSQSYEFKTEVRKLLHIITHSLYTNREIFLRELVSNASDALDKLRFAEAKGEDISAPELEASINIAIDKDAGIITVTDTGIGMSKDELVDNLGTIARSGSERFLAELAESKDSASNIIGRFGVGFYSVFMISDNVTVTTRSYKPGAEAFTWKSDGLGAFEITSAEEAPERGTMITIHVKDDAKEFLETFRLQTALKQHSSFIPFPIYLNGEHQNTTPALWREPKSSISKEQYKEFYNYLTFDDKEPLATIHSAVDAPVQFTSLAFIPTFGRDLNSIGRDDYGLDLYVRRVLIQRECKDLLPDYLSFVKGVVDTEDLPLNISRETLQENVLIRKINQTVTKQILSHLERTAKNDADAYKEFWNVHGKIFRLGYSDYANRDRFAKLLRFNTSTHETADELTSLEEYIERAKEGQKSIYYISSTSREAAKLNPHLEIFTRKGIEVLFLFEPVDEFVMDNLGKFEEFDLVAAETVNPDSLKDFPDVVKKEKTEELSDEETATLSDLLAHIKTLLGDKVTEVRLSERLSGSPAVLSSPDGATSSMEKIMRMMNQDESIPKKVFELNADHPIVRNLLRIYKSDKDDALVKETVEQLFESSLLLEGYLKDPHAMVSRINDILEKAGSWYSEIKKI
ncbi:molecular chaperone HtpG [Halodesulfovibrio spirochaetisodalis]|uniref:Chaperone protein HtpG n=1 Tax=Halodesulfovibrio spirochaetisodalis TaxID=1560234 RepID=A0A1B7XAG3_9BACT|nr:molecular chaperone HtpG [Halodesulfovibrio spirochaetisodalis]OBQ46280.1 molecular chaperone Hsp90 [Halodesulfovibrio spirochaetisodalis]